jgi:hypothetical protein
MLKDKIKKILNQMTKKTYPSDTIHASIEKSSSNFSVMLSIV